MHRDKAIKYFKLAKYQADIFSKDSCKKVGALFLAPESYQILSMGFNGFPRKVNEKKIERWERPEKYFFVCHAEQNGIYNACRHGTPLNNSICIVTLFPCTNCTKGLIQVGITTLISKEPDMNHERWGIEFKYSKLMLEEAGIEIIILTDSEIN
jgi:dCMP deaminase